jgi:hypothetical protein
MTATASALASSAGAATTVDGCVQPSHVVKLAGTYRTEVRYPSPAKRTRFDARRATFRAYPFDSLYPFSVGKGNAAPGTCVVGGMVIGQQSRTLTWDQMKSAYDGDGLRIASNHPYVVDGLRVDNVEDGVAPRGMEDRYPKDGDGFMLRNLYFTYIRDDCVENDDIAGGVIFDSLFDGCYTGVSERPSDSSPQLAYPAPAGEKLLLDHVLLRLQAMSGPRGTNDAGLRGHGQLFKWSSVANSPVIKDSVFLVEQEPNSTSYFPFPAEAKTVNVTIVWRGPGRFRWKVPPGTIVTTDRGVWDAARRFWLKRHGCTSFTSCSRLTTPLPFSSPAEPKSRSSASAAAVPVPVPRATLSPSSTREPGDVPAASKSRRELPVGVAIVALAATMALFVKAAVVPALSARDVRGASQGWHRQTSRRRERSHARALTNAAPARRPSAGEAWRSAKGWLSSLKAWRDAAKAGRDR